MTMEETRRSVLVTGGAGFIGSGFCDYARDRYDLTVLDLPERLAAMTTQGLRTIAADLRDGPALVEAFTGVDTVVHMAARRSPLTPWDQALDINIIGTRNAVHAALAAGCRRFVFGSSIHAVSGYPPNRPIHEDDPVNPEDIYGVSKCFGESYGRYAAEQLGLEFVALRIGACQPLEVAAGPDSDWLKDIYCAPEDLHELIALCIETPALSFEVFNAVSGNDFQRLPIDKAERLLGYRPRFHSGLLRTTPVAVAGPV